MAKTFYTERDILDMIHRGVTTLEINETVVLTDLAKELAIRRGLRLVKNSNGHPEDGDQAELAHRVKAAVIARLGDQVDANLLDAVVARVVNGMK